MHVLDIAFEPFTQKKKKAICLSNMFVAH